MSRKIRKFRTDKFDTIIKRKFSLINLCERKVSSRLHELHESKLQFVSRNELIRSKLSNVCAHVSGVRVSADRRCPRSWRVMTLNARAVTSSQLVDGWKPDEL